MFARSFIDSIDFASNGKELRGEIPFSDLPRLNEMLANSSGALSYRVIGSHEDDSHKLEIVLKGRCNLLCQRCLEEFAYQLEVNAHLQLIPAEMLDEVEDHDKDVIEANRHLDLLELLEDEVLINLPFAPKHPEGTCTAPLRDSQQPANPFAMLAVLKKQ